MLIRTSRARPLELPCPRGCGLVRRRVREVFARGVRIIRWFRRRAGVTMRRESSAGGEFSADLYLCRESALTLLAREHTQRDPAPYLHPARRRQKTMPASAGTIMNDANPREIRATSRPQRAIAGNALRHRWQSWQCWQRRICDLQTLQPSEQFESHPHRHFLLHRKSKPELIFRPR